jgi:hypothetical protein
MYGTDSAGTTMTSLPDIVIFVQENIKFDVFSLSPAKAGKYYLLLDVYYLNLKNDIKGYHQKTFITLQVNLPPVVVSPVVIVTPPPTSTTPAPATNTTTTEPATTTPEPTTLKVIVPEIKQILAQNKTMSSA